MAKGWRKHPEDLTYVHSVQVQQNMGSQPWHTLAFKFREEGFTVRKCAKLCGVSFGSMQRFLNPESKRKAKTRQNELARERRRSDPEYAEESRKYLRRYMQFRAPGREKHNDMV